MKVFKDLFTDDEMCSDAMKNIREEENGLLLVCDSYNVAVGGEDFGIDGNDEEGGGGVDDSVAQMNIVISSFQLQEIPMDKKSFQAVIKKYLKRVKERLTQDGSDRVGPFMDGMKAWIPKMLKEFDEYQFYMGKSCDPDVSFALAKYEEGATYPTFYYIQDGLMAEKF